MFREKEMWFVDVGSTHLKIMGIRRKPVPTIETMSLVDYYRTGLVNRPEDLTPGVLVKILRDTIRTLKCSGKPVRAVLSTPGALVRTIEIPIVSESDLKSAIAFNLSGLVPYDLNHADFDYTIWQIDHKRKIQTILVGIAPQDEIGQLTEILTHANLEPLAVMLDLLAVYNGCLLWDDLTELTIAMIHIGARRTLIVYFSPNQVPFFHAINLGSESITSAIAKTFQTSHNHAELLKLGEAPLSDSNLENFDSAHRSSLRIFVSQIASVLRDIEISHQLNAADAPLNRIILSGGGAPTRELAFLLAQQTRLPVKLWNPLPSPRLKITAAEVNPAWGWHFLPVLGLACSEGICV